MVCHGKLQAGLHYGWTLTWGQKAQFLWDSKGKQNHRNSQLQGGLASEENQVQGQRAICMCSWPKMSCSEVSPNLLSAVLLPMRILCSPADSRGLGVPAPETSRRRITLQRGPCLSPFHLLPADLQNFESRETCESCWSFVLSQPLAHTSQILGLIL